MRAPEFAISDTFAWAEFNTVSVVVAVVVAPDCGSDVDKSE